ncbi:MAG: class I SAM-dependent methyltransferase [Thermodesulfobacteriota bacterium]
MRMNSPTGKKILALVRGGDYAHPGEEAAIDLAMRDFAPDRERLILDVGCGRGGTAQYLQERGWGRVVGFDIDEESIAYARAAYPEVKFLACDVSEAAVRLAGLFHLICLFTTFYALPDQEGALRQLRRVAAARGLLLIFDYLDLAGNGNPLPIREEEGAEWNPIKLQGIEARFAGAGWTILKIDDISHKFGEWYAELVSRIAAREKEILAAAGPAWYRFVHDFYGGMLAAIQGGSLGGVIVTAQAG